MYSNKADSWPRVTSNYGENPQKVIMDCKKTVNKIDTYNKLPYIGNFCVCLIFSDFAIPWNRKKLSQQNN